MAVPAFVNVNDGTNEGLSYTGKQIFTVQYHPEACPGPQDSRYLFDRFIDRMRRSRDAETEKQVDIGRENGKGGASHA